MYCKNKMPVTIYGIKCTVNGKIYVGSSINLDRRFREHQYTVKQFISGVYRYPPAGIARLCKDVQAYGWELFEWYIIEENVPFEMRRERECFWISHYDSTNSEFGYNTRSEQQPDYLPENFIYGVPDSIAREVS